METRKYQLQKKIIEALKANDNDLYSLLKSQWAHRFGVDSLEELKSLDLEQLNQTPNNVDNQKIDQSKENSFEDEKETSIKDDDNQSKEIINKDQSVKGFNIGTNIGRASGQSIFHCHIHLIPRRDGDVENPQGGVRSVIPSKQHYEREK